MKPLPLFVVALALASCAGNETCRVERSDYVLAFMEYDRPVPFAGSYLGYDSFSDFLPSDCEEPHCNLVGDSLFYLEEVTGFESLVARDGTPLTGCRRIETRDCLYSVTAAGVSALRECGPLYNHAAFEE